MSDEDDQTLSLALAPFASDPPAGIDLRGDPSPQGLYSRLRDLRAEARADERAIDNDIVLETRSPALWAKVETLSVSALAERGKDLEIAAWLAEALVRRRGLSGLALAARILAGLVERFWDHGLHPAADPDDPEGRVFAVTGLSGSDRDGSLLQPLRKLALFETADGSPVALWQFQRAQSVAALNDKSQKQQHDKAGVIPFATLEATARTTGQAALLSLGLAVVDARGAWSVMETVFGVVAGAHSPSTGRVSAVLDELDAIVRRYVPAERLLAASPEQNEGGVPPDDSRDDRADGSGAPLRPVSIRARPAERTREELLDDILAIAVQFRKNEPNSPLSYTLEEAVRRARLPLPDLLREIIPELSARSGVLTLLGIRPSDGEN